MNQPSFAVPTFFAILTMAVSVVMYRYKSNIQPDHPTKQPMIAFEFATSSQAIQTLFINPLTGKLNIAFINKMWVLNQIDFLYIGCYTAFSVSFARQAYLTHPTIWGHAAVGLAFIPGLFDVLEDIQLFQILKKVQQSRLTTYEPELTRLSWFTWIKWITLGWLMTFQVPFFWHTAILNLPLSKLMVIPAVIVPITGLVALWNRRRTPIPAVYVLIVFVASLLLSIYTILRWLLLTNSLSV